MIRRRIINLKRGDILYHRLYNAPNYLICGRITDVKIHKPWYRGDGYSATVRYKVFKNIDTYSTTRYDDWRVYREISLDKTATIIEGDELDLLMLKS